MEVDAHVIAGKGPSTCWEFKSPAMEDAGSWHRVWATCYKYIHPCPTDLMSVTCSNNSADRGLVQMISEWP
jgi:hypothetical protein